MSIPEMRRAQNREICESGGRVIGSSNPAQMAITIGQAILGHAPAWPISSEPLRFGIPLYWHYRGGVMPDDIAPDSDPELDQRIAAFLEKRARQ